MDSYHSTSNLIVSNTWSPQTVFSISYRAWSAERESKQQGYGEKRRNELLYNSTMYWNKYASHFLYAIEPDCAVDDLFVFNLITGIAYLPPYLVNKCLEVQNEDNNNGKGSTGELQPLSINGMGNVALEALNLSKQKQYADILSKTILYTVAFTFGKHCSTIDHNNILQCLQSSLEELFLHKSNDKNNTIIHVASHVIARYYEGIGSTLNNDDYLLEALKYYGIALRYASYGTNIPHAYLTPHSIISLLNEHKNLMQFSSNNFLIAKQFLENYICPKLKNISVENAVNLSRAELEMPIFLTWAKEVAKIDLTSIHLGKRHRSKSKNSEQSFTKISSIESESFGGAAPLLKTSSYPTVQSSSSIDDGFTVALDVNMPHLNEDIVLSSKEFDLQPLSLSDDHFAEFWKILTSDS